MTLFLADDTAKVIRAFGFFFITFFFIVLAKMFLEFASWGSLFVFSAAPPHCAAPFTSMGTARPIVVFLLIIFFVAALAQFLIQVYITFLPEFCNFNIECLDFVLLDCY